MRSLEQYIEDMGIQKHLLDKYDFTPYLERYCNISDLIRAFEFDHADDDLPSEFQGCILNFFSESELVDYLSIRYPQYYFPEEITYSICRRNG